MVRRIARGRSDSLLCRGRDFRTLVILFDTRDSDVESNEIVDCNCNQVITTDLVELRTELCAEPWGDKLRLAIRQEQTRLCDRTRRKACTQRRQNQDYAAGALLGRN